jgi:hypothetical protein
MSETKVLTGAAMQASDDDELTAAELDAWEREQILEDPARVMSDDFPRLHNLSAAFLYEKVLRADVPDRPEYVTVPMTRSSSVKLKLAVSEWNIHWEAAQFRRRMFDHRDLPARLERLADLGDVNMYFVPRTRSRYYEYAPLYHLLPPTTLSRFGLPLLRGGQWPFMMENAAVDRFLPDDFEARLGRAWAGAVWRHLVPGSRMAGFTGSDPIRLLAHNLDFWLPAVGEVIHGILQTFPEVDKGVVEERPALEDGTFLDGVMMANPRVGSDLWRGEEEAASTVAEVVEAADRTGHLRGILDAVRSNRIEDDFSPFWTFAREDFERKLYRKRSKVKVRFVELPETITVQGPGSRDPGPGRRGLRRLPGRPQPTRPSDRRVAPLRRHEARRSRRDPRLQEPQRRLQAAEEDPRTGSRVPGGLSRRISIPTRWLRGVSAPGARMSQS